jgi:hypothetical protein
MSNNTILRKYLDILNESETPKAEVKITDPEQIVYAETAQGGSVAKIIESVKAFQRTVKLPETGALDPKTLAAIMSHSSRLAEDNMGNAPAQPAFTPEAPTAPAPTAPAPMAETIQDTLRRKAALHEGYSCGLMAESHHKCVHPEGSHEHLHWHHGYSKGLAECSGVWGMKGTY